ncbi:hypothetical protein WMY93_002694 [Mugilogobius chulae]|uniref:ZP domain-containing protein n=1 Tax=Mugilogobius chulae TaxID=88201 RepID=A0AAW0PUL3_9GOBI
MNPKSKGYCVGVVVICTIATIHFHSVSGEPVDYSARASKHPEVKDDMKSPLTTGTVTARPREKRQHLGSRKNSPEFKTVGVSAKFTPKSKESTLNQYQKNPSVSFDKNCTKGKVKHIVYGRFDIAEAPGPVVLCRRPVWNQRELQPVVECAEDAMTLTVRRTRVVQLRVSTGNDSSLALSKLPPHCGLSLLKGFREISLVVRYNGCLVTVQSGYYVLLLLWRRTSVRMSCPVSRKSSQVLEGLSLCCFPSSLTISIQGPSVFKEPNVKVRGEWTRMLELVQLCGYRLGHRKAEIVITVPFLACGITSRVTIIKIYLFIYFHLKYMQINAYFPHYTTTKTKPVSESLKPSERSPTFYLAPPLYPHPLHFHRGRKPGGPGVAQPTTSTFAVPLKIPQQDEQNTPCSSQVLPGLKDSPESLVKPETHPQGSSSNTQPHNYVFNPYYHYYHLPKIPQTNKRLDSGSSRKSHHSDITPLNLNSDLHTKPPLLTFNAFLHHYLTEKAKLEESQKPKRIFSEVHKEYNKDTDDLRMNSNIWSKVNDQRVTSAVKSTLSANQHSSTHMLNPLLYDHYRFYYGPQSGKAAIRASTFPPQQNKDNVLGKDGGHVFGSDVQPEGPGLVNERESTPYSELSHVDSHWKEWFNQAAPAPPLMSVPHVDSSHNSASMASPFAAPSCPGAEPQFHCYISLGCSALPVKECILGEYLLFSLPGFVVEPKVSGLDHYKRDMSCSIGRLTSDPHLFFVPINNCGVTKQVIDELIVYRLELETCVSGSSLMRMMVECSFYPGLCGAETLFILDPPPPLYTSAVPVQIRIATDESLSFHHEAHLPLSSLRGRLVYMELSLALPPDKTVVLWVHYCLAYTLTPYTSAKLIYDGCPYSFESQRLPSVNPNTQYIMVTSFLTLTSTSPWIVDNVDPEVYFFAWLRCARH